MVYNWNGSGGWRIPYVVKRPGSDPAQHIESLKSLMEENRVDMCKLAAKAARSFELTESQAQQLEAYYWACPAVSQQVVATIIMVQGSVRVPHGCVAAIMGFESAAWCRG